VPLNPFEVLAGDKWSGESSHTPNADPAATGILAGAGGLIWPVSGQVSQVYWPGHRAVDIASQIGTPVYAVADGTVVLSDQDDSRHGIHLLVEHGDGLESFYSHLSAAHVKEGERVTRGQQIGAVGNTGLSTGPHLHFEIRWDGTHLNPFHLLPEIQE
jgi:murein DD-endopeptidase MepM/ murein hydrolase activator NlpD